MGSFQTKLKIAVLVAAGMMLSACGSFEAIGGKPRAQSGAAVPFSVEYQAANVSGGIRPATTSQSSPAALMGRLKYKACMANDVLSNAVPVFGGTLDSTIAILGRSNCQSLHRALETWTKAPDFKLAAERIALIRSRTGKDFDYGMFIAEAVSLKEVYRDDAGTAFDFAAMCKAGSRDMWGPDTCVPHFDSPEFVRYVKYITGKAVDAGITNILFGQTGHTDPSGRLASLVPDLRAIASQRGKALLIGQQPNGNQPPAYLKVFDYIVGPSYVGHDVSQACLPGTNCQAVLFHSSVVRNANNVISELDFASTDDDIHRYGKLSPAAREALLNQMVPAFFSAGVGFVFPLRIILNGGSSVGNCYGPNQYIYTSDRALGCRDEDFINAMLEGRFSTPVVTTTPPVTVGSGSGTTAGSGDTSTGNPSGGTAPDYRNIVLGAYIHVLGRPYAEAVADTAGVNYWIARMQNGLSATAMSNEMRGTNEYFIRITMYRGIFKREGDKAGVAYWIGQLSSGAKSRAQVQADFKYACDNKIGGECR